MRKKFSTRNRPENKPTRFRVPWSPCGTSLKLRGDILYATAGDVVSLRELISENNSRRHRGGGDVYSSRKLVDTADAA
ncbi:hypothetical protein A8H26_23590 [Pluralibacter gergoviae]|nr:hypothetical protein A8H26_23590 [Pluralibacter gergoviae]